MHIPIVYSWYRVERTKTGGKEEDEKIFVKIYDFG